MFRKKTTAIGLALLLGASAWANEGASFLVGPSFLYSVPGLGISGIGPGINFDLHFPLKTEGLEYGMRSFLATSTWSKYANIHQDENKDDIDRKYYFAGVALGPKFRTQGNLYFQGTVGLLIVGNYAVQTNYYSVDKNDNEVLSEQADLSVGGEGSVGMGYTLPNKITFELSILAQGGSSENAPGPMFSIGPKFTMGMSL